MHLRDLLDIFRLSISFFACFLLLVNTPVSAQIFPDTTSKEQEPPVPEFPEDSLNRRTPRGAVNGFIKAIAEENNSNASRYLNLEGLEGEQEGEVLVRRIQRLLDRGGQIMPYSWIKNTPEGRVDDDLPPGVDRFGTISLDGETIDLYVEQTEDAEGAPVWLISSETLKEVAAVEIEESPLVEKILPDYLQDNTWAGIAIGQWLIMILLIIPAYLISWLIIWGLKSLLRLLWPKARTETTAGIIHAFALPIRIYLSVWLFIFLSQEVGISILLRQRFSGITLVIGIIAVLILLWQLTDFVSKLSKRHMNLRGLVSWVSIIMFLRRVIKVAIVVFGIIAVLGALGFDVTTGLAALGIGGLALALGAQRTVENFVGGVSLISDQPIRVGDYCKVGDVKGHVESIGMRSTRIRTDQRTVVTIPNGEFATKNIENFAQRDKFLFQTILGFRFETTPEQVEYLLVELRAILYAHPLVDPNPARIRFIGLGESSLNLEIYSFINAKDFDQYLEVREDILLRMIKKVEESGTDFAFPSQTLYFAHNYEVSEEKIAEIRKKVGEWKEKNELQIPSFDPDRIKDLKNKIKYPREGSFSSEESNKD